MSNTSTQRCLPASSLVCHLEGKCSEVALPVTRKGAATTVARRQEIPSKKKTRQVVLVNWQECLVNPKKLEGQDRYMNLYQDLKKQCTRSRILFSQSVSGH